MNNKTIKLRRFHFSAEFLKFGVYKSRTESSTLSRTAKDKLYIVAVLIAGLHKSLEDIRSGSFVLRSDNNIAVDSSMLLIAVYVLTRNT